MKKLSFVLASALLMFSCGEQKEDIKVVTEDSKPIEDYKIISIGGEITENLYALGLGNHVVAIDVTSTYPEEVNL